MGLAEGDNNLMLLHLLIIWDNDSKGVEGTPALSATPTTPAASIFIPTFHRGLRIGELVLRLSPGHLHFPSIIMIRFISFIKSPLILTLP